MLGKKAEKVSLVIKDVTGRTVRELQPGTDAGYHRVTWDSTWPEPRRRWWRSGRPGGGGGGGGPRPKGPNPGPSRRA